MAIQARRTAPDACRPINPRREFPARAEFVPIIEIPHKVLAVSAVARYSPRPTAITALPTNSKKYAGRINLRRVEYHKYGLNAKVLFEHSPVDLAQALSPITVSLQAFRLFSADRMPLRKQNKGRLEQTG
jgi:hypothetical protein